MRRKAFTLIELLVVVAIIALLIAILLPSLGRAKANAVRVKCAAVLKQWGLVVRMYAQENNDYFGTSWKDALPGTTTHAWTSQSPGSTSEIYDAEWAAGGTPLNGNWKYSGGMRICPGDPLFGQILNNPNLQTTAFRPPVDYAMCRYLPTTSGKEMWKLGELNHPTTTMLMADAPPTLGTPFEISRMGDLDGPGPEKFTDSLQKRHMGIGNILFVDGHVEQHNYQDFVNNIQPSTGPNDYTHAWTFQNVP